MSDMISSILGGNLPELLGDLYTPVAACVAAAWAIIAFAALCEAFKVSMCVIFNLKNK